MADRQGIDYGDSGRIHRVNEDIGDKRPADWLSACGLDLRELVDGEIDCDACLEQLEAEAAAKTGD